MLITATAFTYHELGQGKAGSPSYGEGSEVWGGSVLPDTPYYTNPDYRESQLGKAGSPTSSGDTTQAIEALAYWDQRGEAGSPLVSERIGCYPEEEYNARPCVSDFSAINLGEAGSPVVREQSQCYPEMDAGCPRDSFLTDVPSGPALTTGTSVSGVQFEEWPEVGFDSYTYYRFMVEQGKLEQAKASSPTLSIDQRFPPGSLPEDTAGETEIFDEGVLPGRYWTIRAPGKEKAPLSIDQRFPPGSLPED
jgi:hypothetical protein